MENMKDFEQRMYFLVLYSLSPIQKGIQAGHAALEYANIYSDTDEYKRFIDRDKTWILLDGGTTNDSEEEPGTLNQALDELEENGINYAIFREPDLNDSLTCICFLADERVWNRVDYPDYELSPRVRSLISISSSVSDDERLKQEDYENWKQEVGADVAFLKQFLGSYRLAR